MPHPRPWHHTRLHPGGKGPTLSLLFCRTQLFQICLNYFFTKKHPISPPPHRFIIYAPHTTVAPHTTAPRRPRSPPYLCFFVVPNYFKCCNTYTTTPHPERYSMQGARTRIVESLSGCHRIGRLQVVCAHEEISHPTVPQSFQHFTPRSFPYSVFCPLFLFQICLNYFFTKKHLLPPPPRIDSKSMPHPRPWHHTRLHPGGQGPHPISVFVYYFYFKFR